MASFELYDYESGETKLSLVPQFKKYEFMNVFWYEYNDPGEPVKTTVYESTFNYDDIVLLRDFLSNAIDLYDLKRKKKEKTKKAKKDSINNKSSQ